MVGTVDHHTALVRIPTNAEIAQNRNETVTQVTAQRRTSHVLNPLCKPLDRVPRPKRTTEAVRNGLATDQRLRSSRRF